MDTNFGDAGFLAMVQLCARHGRTVLTRSWRPQTASYATNITEAEKSLPLSGGELPAEQTTPGHPDEPSSILDTTSLPPTPRTRAVLESLQSAQSSISAAQLEVNAHFAAATGGVTADPTILTPSTDSSPPTTATNEALLEYKRQKRRAAKLNNIGSNLTNTYNPDTLIHSPPKPSDLTLPMLLANQTHLGHHTSLWHPGNSSYIFGIRNGIHIISLDTTFAYLQRAAKVIRSVAYHGGLILFLGTRPKFTPIVTTAARRSKGYHIFDRWVPGTLTNGQQLLSECAVQVVDVNDQPVTTLSSMLAKNKHSVIRPDLVVCLNPLENEVALHECGLNTVPTIGIIDTDCNPAWVTYPIPANDDSLRSVTLIAGVLSNAAQEGQEARLAVARTTGRPTYSTIPVDDWIKRTQELVSVDVSESVGRGEEGAGTGPKAPTADV